MAHVRLDTAELPVEQRFDAWAEFTARAHGPTVMETRHHANFVACIDAYEFGPLRVSHLSHPPLRARGAPNDNGGFPEVVMLTHVIRGSMTEHSPARTLTAEAGSLMVLDTRRPSTVVNPVAVAHSVLHLPAAMVGLTLGQIATLVSAPLSARDPVGGLIAHILADLLHSGEQYEPVILHQLTSTLIDLLGAAARWSGQTATLAPRALPERSRRLQIYAFMRQRLADPGLTPQVVAAAHAISVRQLNRIIEEDGESPAQWIRRQRLDRCRRDLTDPELADRPVATIGARWGFADPATFNRAFQRQFGLPPGEYRRRFAPEAHGGR
jgi:AraC-like DNA-binding protein